MKLARPIVQVFACVLLASLLAALAPGVQAVWKRSESTGDETAITEKGYDRDQLYFAIGEEEVNAFNFSLVIGLSTRVGFSTPVDGGLSLSLQRVYNSNFVQKKTWYTQRECPPDEDDSALHKTEYLSMPRQNPLGLGWQFHLGRVYKKDYVFCDITLETARCYGGGTTNPQVDLRTPGEWTYVAPDGAEHQLIWNAVESAAAGPLVNVYYSRDGSLFKAVEDPSGWRLYLPDGRILEMTHRVEGVPIVERLGMGESACQNDPYQTCAGIGDCPLGSCAQNQSCFYDAECAPHTCLGKPACNMCSDGVTSCASNNDCPDGICMTWDPNYKGNPCRSDNDCGPDGFCAGAPDCLQGCSNSTEPCDTVEDCPAGVCADNGDCENDAGCVSGICSDPPVCMNQDSHLEPDQPSSPPYLYDRDKIGFHTKIIRMREEEPDGTPEAFIELEYHDAPFDYIIETISDSHSVTGRQVDVQINDNNPSVPSYGQITRIVFPAPDTALTQSTAEFEFEYQTIPLTLAPYTVDVLWKVTTQPQGYQTEYQYYDSSNQESPDPPPFGLDWNGTANIGGKLRGIKQPSGKYVRFHYNNHYRYWMETVLDPANTPAGHEPYCGCVNSQHKSFVHGISSKKEWLVGEPANDTIPPDRVWVFAAGSDTLGPYSADAHDETCDDWHVCATKSRFADSYSEMTDPADNISRIYYDTSSGTQDDPPETGPLYGTAKQELYYEGPSVSPTELVKQNEKVWTAKAHDPCQGYSWTEQVSDITTYTDDGDTTLRTDYTEWNGWHYEVSTTSGNAMGDWKKIGRTDYAMDNDCGVGSAEEQIYESWFPNLVAASSVSVEEGGQTTVVESTDKTFDPDTGRTTSVIRRKTPTAAQGSCQATMAPGGAEDLKTVYTYDDAGNVLTETVSFGNDADPYTTTYGYEYGVQTKVERSGLSYVDRWVTEVDPHTSLSTVEYYAVAPSGPPDSRSIRRETWYDELRRPYKEQIEATEPFFYDYEDVSFDGRKRLARIRKHRGTGTDRIESVEHYDKSGRVFKNEKLNPDDTRAYQHTCFNDDGRVEFVSEWTATASIDCGSRAGVAGTETSYTYGAGYEDPFGRPRTVVGSLGERTTYDYFGTNKEVTVEDIEGEQGSFHLTTTYYTDGLGRLRVVEADTDIGAVPKGAEAIYKYDYADRLEEVRLVQDAVINATAEDRYNTKDPGTGQEPAGQLRTFAYDSLGRQETATHPENGTVETLAWNAMGSPKRVQDELGRTRQHVLVTDYDAVGRPTDIRRELDVSGFSSAPTWNPQGWASVSTSTCGAEPGPATAWYHGEGCSYADSGQEYATLTSSAIGPLPAGATLSFEYYREVRKSDTAESRDRLRVLVTDAGSPDWDSPTEIFELDSTQISWIRWKRSPAIPLDEFATQTVLVRFEFDSVDDFANGGTRRGVFLGDIAVRRPQSVTLAEVSYDQDHCGAGNKFRGKVTTVRAFDEATLAYTWERQYCFVQEVGQLTSETMALDWDRSGQMRQFEANYTYTPMGQLDTQTMPHPAGETGRVYDYDHRHGALTNVTATKGSVTQELLLDSPTNPGIEYNPSGGMSLVRHGNELETRLDVNAAFLPHNIWTEDTRPGGSTVFSTGLYDYDGARNIKQIGTDLYRYDGAGRLDSARVHSVDYPTVDLDYTYDIYGNMLSRAATDGPAGLDFSGRTYANNQITGFVYDDNGNLIEEPTHDGVGGYRYGFSPQNQMMLARGLSGGKIFQQVQYDLSGHRWARVISAEGGKGLVTLRDAGGQVASEYEERDADSGLELTMEYVRGNGRLLVENSACGPRPKLRYDSPMTREAGGDTFVRFVKTDYVEPDQQGGGYTIHIEAENGQTNTLTRPWDLADQFEIDQSEFFSIQNNWVRIQTEAECGQTGYSNAASYHFINDPTGCLRMMGSHRDGFSEGGSSSMKLSSNASACDPVTVFNLYFRDAGTGQTIQLNPVPLFGPEAVLPDLPPGAGHGDFWLTPVDPGTGEEGPASPASTDDERSTASDTGGVPGYPSVNPQYLHWDHLGSTRLMTDEMGVTIGEWKYYPFGHEAETSGGRGNRMKFTGHERDDRLGMDYMLARYYGANLGRFLSTDPLAGSAGPGNSQTWNRYSYVGNNPLVFIDPNGEARYLILVGDPGLGPEHNVGTNFERVAGTRQSELQAAGHSADVARVSTVTDMSAAMSSGDTIGGGVIVYAHGGVLSSPSGDTPAVFLGEGTGADTNLTAGNASTLSGSNLGSDATIELNACHSAPVAQPVADATGVSTSGVTSGMSFSPTPDQPMDLKPGTRPPESGPLYLVPNPGGEVVTREPQQSQSP